MSTDQTREGLQAQIAALTQQLNDLHPVPEPPHSVRSTDRTTVTETPQQTTIKTVPGQPTEATFRSSKVAVNRTLLQKSIGSGSSADELIAKIASIRSLIVSGVDSAGYGDKRTEFRSLTDLRLILNALEGELALLTTGRGRVRQIRMTTQADKGL